MAEYMSKLVQCTSDMTATTIAKMEAEGYTLHGVVYGDFGLRHMQPSPLRAHRTWSSTL